VPSTQVQARPRIAASESERGLGCQTERASTGAALTSPVASGRAPAKGRFHTTGVVLSRIIVHGRPVGAASPIAAISINFPPSFTPIEPRVTSSLHVLLLKINFCTPTAAPVSPANFSCWYERMCNNGQPTCRFRAP
jgi:hypothetical protein